ncbi:DUF5763 domain-containing protein [Psychroserpens sp. SPM9]|uniref:DUF5763 domain-containing protein n=1 Tax=Psychroserpens sp. SPM9 TaxID=2975598 RepID=UPI0021A8F7FF|nr:DUF5763 domain-containing protein [Psychroserpens sp. SPM9]MDG5490045.1 DUF5763 domain-containing protein [Psychroserpens sp. SPM9]
MSAKGLSQSLYKTPSGKKYHLASCRMVENVSEKITIEDISVYNLTACKICKPKLKTLSNAFSSPNKAVGASASVQCKGITKKGTRCKHKTRLANGYCYQHTKKNNTSNGHQPSTETTTTLCGARTKSGGYCKRKVKNGSRCYQH